MKVGDKFIGAESEKEATLIHFTHTDYCVQYKDGTLACGAREYFDRSFNPYVEPPKKKTLTEFLYQWNDGKDFYSSWAESIEEAKELCSRSDVKLVKWGLRTVEVDDEI